MRQLTAAFTVAPLFLFMASAQDTTPRTATSGSQGYNNSGQGQTFVGILVDSRCASTGASNSSGSNPGSGYMAKSTASSADQGPGLSESHSPQGISSSTSTTGMANRGTPTDQGSIMTRTSPAESGRTWNSTDMNTSGTADRTGTGGAADMNQGGVANSGERSAAYMGRGTTDGTGERGNDINRSAAGSAVNHGSADRSATSTGRTTGDHMNSDMSQTTTGSHHGDANGTDTQSANNPGDRWNSTGDMASAQAGVGQGSWDRSCFISANSSSYVLHLQDGRTLRLDQPSSERVSQQLQTTGRVSNMNKIFRVKVTGTADGDTLHISDIQM